MAKFDSLWDYDNPQATEATFRALLPEAGDERGELLTQIARALGLQGRFEEARAMLEEEARPECPQGSRAWVRLHLELGRVFNSSDRKPLALPLFVQAYDAALSIREDGLAVDAAHMVAIAESGEHVLKWNLIALELAETSDQPPARRWRKSIQNNLGWAHFDAADFQAAMACFEASREAAEEADDPESERIARWCIARTFRALGKPERAMAILGQLLKELRMAGKSEQNVLQEIAECEALLASRRQIIARGKNEGYGA